MSVIDFWLGFVIGVVFAAIVMVVAVTFGRGRW